jgi:predicted nucleotidyltransferase
MILRKIAEVYRSVYGDELVSIFLYGSYARGDYQSDSDIDVAAIVRGDRRSLQDRLRKVWDVSSDLELGYGTIVSPTVIPYEEYEKYKNDLPYYKNIAREGVKISV